MPHPPRHDAPDTLHHVWNRGASRRSTFEWRKEIRFFKSRLVKEVRAERILVIAYTVMRNHFHLLIYSLVGEISRSLQSVQSQHVRRFNHPRGRNGALFQGRFRSRRLKVYAEVPTVVRYIHHNPAKAKGGRPPELYPHSSAHDLAGERRPRAWLRRSWAALPAALRPQLGKPLDPAAVRLIEARMANSTRAYDPLEDLYGQVPACVEAWFRSRAEVADQHVASMPVADAQTVLVVCAQLEEAEVRWVCDPSGRRIRSAWPLAKSALLRELCGMSWIEIGTRLGVAASTAMALHRAHGRCILADSSHAARFGALAARCLRAGGF